MDRARLVKPCFGLCKLVWIGTLKTGPKFGQVVSGTSNNPVLLHEA